jgi:methionine-rich copper-binding protein CopC
MRRRVLPVLLLLCVFAPALQAHAHLEEASPADGSVLHGAPQQLVLRFSEPARLTTLSIERDGAAAQKIAPLPGKSEARIVVPLPALAAGRYRVRWRALSADGHVVPGELHFTLNP